MPAPVRSCPTRTWGLLIVKARSTIKDSSRAARPNRKNCIGPPRPHLLFELLQQPSRRAVFARLESLAPARGIDGDGRQQRLELRGRAGIEAAVGALGQTRDLAKGLLRARIG